MITIPGRIPVRIFPLFWMLIFMIGWMNTNTLEGTAIWGVVILISILFHEFGHALTARLFGQEAAISLVGIGGQTTRRGDSLSKWKEFLIVLNGPLAGLLLFYLLYKLRPSFASEQYPTLNYALKIGIQVNLFWTILNLLPVWPLDGGHLMRILLEGAFGMRGFKIALWVSMILAVLFGTYFFITQQVLVGAVFLMLGFEGYRAWTDVKQVTPQDADLELQADMKRAFQQMKAGQLDEALAGFLAVRDRVKKGIVYTTATQHIGKIYIEQGQFQKAYDVLMPLKKQLTDENLFLLQQLAYRLQKWDETVKIGTQIYQEQHVPDAALLNALSCAIMGQVGPTVGWLRCAAQSGVKDMKAVINKREFDAIRETPEFAALSKSI